MRARHDLDEPDRGGRGGYYRGEDDGYRRRYRD